LIHTTTETVPRQIRAKPQLGQKTTLPRGLQRINSISFCLKVMAKTKHDGSVSHRASNQQGPKTRALKLNFGFRLYHCLHDLQDHPCRLRVRNIPAHDHQLQHFLELPITPKFRQEKGLYVDMRFSLTACSIWNAY
jgi:hypothetical protein